MGATVASGGRRPALGRALALGVALALGGGALPALAPAAAATASPAALPLAAGAQPNPTAPTPGFADVPPGYWAAPAISGLARLGAVSGTDGHFHPAAPETRAEFATMLTRLAGVPAGTAGPPLADVPPGTWYAAAVEAAVGLGWMAPQPDGDFSPDMPMTGGESSVAAAAYLGLTHVANDLGAGSTAGAWRVAGDLGLLANPGDPAGPLQAGRSLTRAEAAELLWRLHQTGAAAVADVGGRAAAYVHIDTGNGTAEVGATVTIRAYAHDHAGFIVPAAFTWGLSGPARELSASGNALTLRVTGAGDVRLRASVTGEAPAAVATLPAYSAAALAVAGLPPAGLAHAAFAVTVHAVTAGGAPDPARAGGSVLLGVRRAGRRAGAPLSVSAPLVGGAATLQMPDLAPGRYVLSLTAPGLPAVRLPYRAVRRPLGRIALSGGQPVLAVGVRGSLQATVPAAGGGAWPLTASAEGTPVGPPAPGGPAVVTASAAGDAVAVTAGAPGQASVTVSVPGGALRPAAATVTVTPTGALHPAPAPQPTPAGRPSLLHATTSGTVRDVRLIAIDPAGHVLPAVDATVSGDLATASFTAHTAGTWRFVWAAGGAIPASGGTVQVLPGPAAQVVVDPEPTSVLAPGGHATLRAFIADAWGNPLPEPFRLAASAPLAGLALAAGTLPGPAAVGTYTAPQRPGTAVVELDSPDHPDLPPVRLVFRTVAAPADRVAGKGLWLTFPDWRYTPDAQILAEARREGATHLYLEVATSSDGYYGARALDDLLPKAHAAGLAVIAWVYAALVDPAADTALLRQVAAYRTPAGDAADGLALDIEQRLDPAAVAAYAAAARRAAGPDGLVVGVTWAPQQKPGYPYAALAPSVDVFAPMDYWHVDEADYSYAQVYSWVRASVETIRARAGLPKAPVSVIAETFDWFAGGVGRGIWSPTAAEEEGALRGAGDAGALGVSIYRASTATPAEAAAIAATPWPPPG